MADTSIKLSGTYDSIEAYRILEEMRDMSEDYEDIKTEAEAAASAATAAVATANAAVTNATTAANNASTYAGNANTSASDAAGYAANASTSATNAATSETNASNSASAAATSESNAATSETNASDSATAAAASAAEVEAALDDYLPLSGGTMTGAITRSGGAIVADTSNNASALFLNAFSDGTNGAQLGLYGKDHAGIGRFSLNAMNGSSIKSLHGYPDGTLTWNNSNILTAANYNSYALPLSGGTMSGSIRTNAVYMNTVDNGAFKAWAGTDTTSSYFYMYGKNDPSYGGYFQLKCNDGTNTCSLVGSPSGNLTWGGVNLLPVGVVQAFAGTTIPNGWLLCDGSAVSRTTYANLFACIGTTYGSGDGSTTFNVPNLIDKFVEGSATSGTEKSAGLPNITGSFYADFILIENYQSDGAFSQTKIRDWNLNPGGNGNAVNKQDFDASLSNSIYGNSTTVQPPALTMKYIIKY